MNNLYKVQLLITAFTRKLNLKQTLKNPISMSNVNLLIACLKPFNDGVRAIQRRSEEHLT